MPEGLGYVLAAYGAALVTLLAWFWLITVRFRRVRQLEHEGTQPGVTTQ